MGVDTPAGSRRTSTDFWRVSSPSPSPEPSRFAIFLPTPLLSASSGTH
jgi:hypothetical protein